MSQRFIRRKLGCLASTLKLLLLFLMLAVFVSCGSGEADQSQAPASVASPTATLAPGMASSIERQARLMHHMLRTTWDQLGAERQQLMEEGFEKGFFELDDPKLTEECRANLESLKSQLINLLGRSDYPAQQEILDLLTSVEAQSCRLNDLEIIGYYERLRALTR